MLELEPITELGGGMVQEKQKAFLNEIIKKLNDLFEGDLTEQDKLVYVNNVIILQALTNCLRPQRLRTHRGVGVQRSDDGVLVRLVASI